MRKQSNGLAPRRAMRIKGSSAAQRWNAASRKGLTQFLKIGVVVPVGALLLVACGNGTPSADELNLEGTSLSRAMKQIEEYDIALVPAPNCEFEVLNGSESTLEVWTPTAAIPEEFVEAIRIEDIRESEPGTFLYCGSLQLDLLPEIESDTEDLILAQQLCAEGRPFLSGSLVNLTPNELERGLSLPNLDAIKVNRQTPQFYDLQRFYFLAWNLVDYIDGLNWLEWVSRSSDEIADQRISSIDPLVRENGNLTVIGSWRDALEKLELSQKSAASLCGNLSSLVAQPGASSQDGQSDGGVAFAEQSVSLPNMEVEHLTVSPDGEWLLAASQDQVAVVSLPDLRITAVVPVDLLNMEFGVSSVAIDDSSSFGVISVANYDSSLMYKLDPRSGALSMYDESPGRVGMMHFKEDGTGILGSCPVEGQTWTCGIFVRDEVGRIQMVETVQWPSRESVFGGVAEDPQDDSLLVAAPNQLLYRVDISAGQAEEVRLEREVWNKSNSVIQSPLSREIFIVVDRGTPPSGQKVELRELTGSGLGEDVWEPLNERTYPAQLALTSVPNQVAYIATSSPYQDWDVAERTRDLHIVDLASLSNISERVRVGNGTDVPPMATHPNLPYIYVGTSSSSEALADTDQITAVPINEGALS